MSEKQYVAVIEVWLQCSADYNAVKSTATKVLRPETTVQEIMDWNSKINSLGKGDVKITEAAP